VNAPAPEVLRQQISRLRSVPTLPSVLAAVVSALEDPDVDFEAVAELIETDQALASQLLRLANSAFYSAQGRIGRVSQALVTLGVVVTRSIALSTSVLDLRKVPLRGFWEHSLGCAVAAGAIAKATGRAHPEEATAAGLLHDLGKVVLCQTLPDVFTMIAERAAADGRSYRETERELLGTDHGEIAAWLVERWRFPPSLAEPITFHHTPALARSRPDETAIVHVANVAVRALGYGFGGDAHVPAIDAKAWGRLGLTPDRLDQVLDLFETDLDHALNYALFD